MSLAAAALALGPPLSAADLSSGHFEKAIKPLFKEYCVTCHSTEKHKGDLDLERFSSLEAIRKEPKIWQGVIEQIVTEEMPPKDKPQFSPEQREKLLGWTRGLLDDIALSQAGDPGPVVLRRLSNAEYTYTLRDLTGVPSLDPAREFPTDSASGEGFMNVGNSLVMSPSLVTKYLDAAKQAASHALLTPDGFRFSASSTRRDWTEEILAEIRSLYGQFTDNGGGSSVNLQGIKFDTKDGGVLPLDKYLAATLELKASDDSDSRLPALAAERRLSPKYLLALWNALRSDEPSLLLDPIRARWKAAQPQDAEALASEISQWQHALWKFNSVGHIGKANGPKTWLEPFSPIADKQEIRLKIPAAQDGKEIRLYLSASDATDGNAGDFVLWERPRLVAPGQPELLLKDVRSALARHARQRAHVFASTAKALAAAAEAMEQSSINAGELARKHGVDEPILTAWLRCLGIGDASGAQIQGRFTQQLQNVSGYSFVSGWGKSETPSIVANASDQHIRIPGNLKPRSVAVHPAPQLAVAAGWKSPVSASARVEALIQHAHPECGNGVTWAIELRRGSARLRLASGTAQGGAETGPPAIEHLRLRRGDHLALLIGARDGNHSCDLTAVNLTITLDGPGGNQWDLAKDTASSILAGNPHPDRFGNADIWHFYAEPDTGAGPALPAGSLLARWQTSDAEERGQLARRLQALLSGEAGPAKDSPDAALLRQLVSLNGPLFKNLPETRLEAANDSAIAAEAAWGLDAAAFGRHPNSSDIEASSICAQAPSLLEIRLPADFEGWELVTTGRLHPETGGEGSAQLQALAAKPAKAGLIAGAALAQGGRSAWTDADQPPASATPIITQEGSEARRRIESSLEEFRQLFPAALCYTKIVPVDEVVTLTLYHREDGPFVRLMLDEAQTARLNRLWDELHFVSQDALTLVDAFEQLWQYATQDADPKVFEPMRGPIQQRAAAFRKQILDAEPRHLEAALRFADQAYRRPATEKERDDLRQLYRTLREQELPHEEAIRLTLARILVAPAFLYKAEKPGPGTEAAPVIDWELASRLSYFLWSSAPDAPLLAAARAGKLTQPDTLAREAARLLRDGKSRRLAVEFACAWLHIYDFDQLSEKSERHFPEFSQLRGAMREETIRFFTDLFQNDGSILDILNANYAFVNADLARHYGMENVKFQSTNDWQRVEDARQFSRGGILGQAAILAKQSGASRTSPILRGNWVSEALLGEKLPRPPKDVPLLPEDEGTEGLTVRQMVEKHSNDPKCYGCHRRIDPYGYSLEAFDAIGRRRERDQGGRVIDTRAKAMDGAEFDGMAGLREYLLNQRRGAFLNQFCRKLLGYALGRGVLLSDEPLIAEMRRALEAKDHRFSAAVETIVRSRQFREIRGKDMASE